MYNFQVDARYLILLTDSLLYCEYAGSWVDDNSRLSVTYVIPLQQLRVRQEDNNDTFPTEFSIISKVRSYIVRAR